MSTTLTVTSYVVANLDVRIELRPTLGAYELGVLVNVRTTAPRSDAWWIKLHSARVTLGADISHALGTARPVQSEFLRQDLSGFARTVAMALPLQPHQLAAIEDLRDGGDLDLNIVLHGEGGDGGQIRDSCETPLRIVVPRSSWIEQLRNARALNVLLLEIPMPVGTLTGAQPVAAAHLRQAQLHFVNGHYDDCVGACRLAMEAIGAPASALDRYTQNRRAMTKEERGQGMYAAILHFNHPAHHPGGAPYSRSDAKLSLQLAAACAAAGAF